jgi:iron(III) transport system ATP-binding protein
MSNARIAQVGAPRELYEHPANPFVADFIGDANLIDAEAVAEAGGGAVVRAGTLWLELPGHAAAEGPVQLAVRPDAIEVHEARPDAPAIAARILRAAYIGRHVEYRVHSPLGELFVIERARRHPVKPGTDVWISLSPDGVAIIRERLES